MGCNEIVIGLCGAEAAHELRFGLADAYLEAAQRSIDACGCGLCRAVYGNALRVAGRLSRAEAILSAAAAEAGSERGRAWAVRFLAALATERERYLEAADLYRQATEMSERCGCALGRASSVAGRARALAYAHDWYGGRDLAAQGLQMDGVSAPVVISLTETLALCMASLGNQIFAHACLERAALLYGEIGMGDGPPRVSWLRAKIEGMRPAPDYSLVADLCRQAREGLADAGEADCAATVAIEEAEALSRCGRSRDALALARWLSAWPYRFEIAPARREALTRCVALIRGQVSPGDAIGLLAVQPPLAFGRDFAALSTSSSPLL